MDERRAAEGLEHLQSAAHELIAAARVFLDAVEDLVDEPERVTQSLATVVDLFKDAAGRRPQPWESHAWTAAETGEAPHDTDDDSDGPVPDRQAKAPAPTTRPRTRKSPAVTQISVE